MVESNNSNVCLVCHQPVLPEYYFCPNCGNKINSAPLSTSAQTQAGLYFFSAILPLILFIGIPKWKGLKYLKSKDPKTKKIGIIACVILAVSIILTIFLAYVWTKQTIQSAIDSINLDMGF